MFSYNNKNIFFHTENFSNLSFPKCISQLFFILLNHQMSKENKKYVCSLTALKKSTEYFLI